MITCIYLYRSFGLYRFGIEYERPGVRERILQHGHRMFNRGFVIAIYELTEADDPEAVKAELVNQYCNGAVDEHTTYDWFYMTPTQRDDALSKASLLVVNGIQAGASIISNEVPA